MTTGETPPAHVNHEDLLILQWSGTVRGAAVGCSMTGNKLRVPLSAAVSKTGYAQGLYRPRLQPDIIILVLSDLSLTCVNHHPWVQMLMARSLQATLLLTCCRV